MKMSTSYRYGLHTLKTLLKTHPEQIQQLWIEQHRNDQRVQEIITLAEQEGISCSPISKLAMVKKVGEVNHQGVLASCRDAEMLTETALLAQIAVAKSPVLLLILDGIQDPHNLGACLRSANA